MRSARRRGLLALATAWALAVAAPSSAQPAVVLDVPYVAQSEALCGGAAAAMVMRYWGARGVAAEDFASLLNARKDGIETGVLVQAMVARGWRALAFTGTTASVAHHVTRRRPVIALIEVGPGRFHFIVIVGIDDARVTYHDPADRPLQTMPVAGFERAWSASSRWALLLLPRESGPSLPALDESVSLEPASVACRPALAQAADAAARRDLARAEQLVVEAREACPTDAAPSRELAGLRLLQQRWADAAALAREAVARDAGDRHAWKILGTAEFLQRNQVEALRAWNHVGEPRIDLVRIDGLRRTRQRVVADRVGVHAGDVVTAAALARAQRRLAELPAAAASRVEVAPVGSGLAEIRAAVLEHPLMPTSRLALAAMGARAAVSREVAWAITSPAGGGERLAVMGRWWEARPAVALTLGVPVATRWIDGVVTLGGSVARESFAPMSTAPTVEEHRAAAVTLSDWATASLRWDATARLDSWSQDTTATAPGLGAGLERRWEDRGAVRVHGLHWPTAGFGVASLAARWRWSPGGEDRLLTSVTLAAASEGAPRTLWSGAGTGHGRTLLLRAHPLLDEGVIAGAVFGRRIAHAGIEARHTVASLGPVRVRAAAFVDAAAASHGDRIARGQIDAGVGVRVRVAGEGALRADYARGLADGSHAFSVAWELPWPSWP